MKTMKKIMFLFTFSVLLLGTVTVFEASTDNALLCGYPNCNNQWLTEDLCNPNDTCHDSAVYYWNTYCGEYEYPC